jgi:hypothetical protein
MRSNRNFVGTFDYPISDMTGCTGDAFKLKVPVIADILGLNGLFDVLIFQPVDNPGLLVLQRSMAIETDPDIFILFPVSLKKRVHISLCMIGGLPFLVNFLMTHPTVLCPDPGNASGNLLVRDRMSKILPQAKDHPC